MPNLMYRAHFELLQPLCPVCRIAGREPEPLRLERVVQQQDEDILEGLLRCPSPLCRHEYPILDGVPVIVPQLREYVRGWIERIRGREPFSEAVESLLGDCCGTGTSFEDERQRLSSYAWDHWGEFDPLEEQAEPSSPSSPASAGSVVRVLHQGLQAVAAKGEPLPEGPVLDLGCAVGRTSVELAQRFDRPVLGVDLDLTMLRMARSVRDAGKVSYPRRRVGLAYDRRTFEVPQSVLKGVRCRIDFWCCDATVLPFADAQFSCTSSLNLLDCVASPLAHLQELARTLRPEGCSVLASPYDWSSAATPVEAWLGGHSQRSDSVGSSQRFVRELLTPGGHPAAIEGLQVIAEYPHVPWCVRLHERAIMHYHSDLLVMKKPAANR